MKITSGSHPGLEMDTDSPAFQHFLSWLAANGAPTPTIEDGQVGPTGPTPQEIVFRNSGKTFSGEALAFYLSPSMGLTEVQKELGFGDPMHSVPYPPYVAAKKPLPDVIDFKVDRPIPGRPGYFSVAPYWQGKAKFGDEARDASGNTYILVDEGGPFNRDGLWKQTA